MRHSDPCITLGIYGHVVPQLQRDAAERLAARIESELLTDAGIADSAARRCLVSVSLVGAVGIELKAMLKARKLLISLNARNAKNSGFAQVRYMPGTRRLQTKLWTSGSEGTDFLNAPFEGLDAKGSNGIRVRG